MGKMNLNVRVEEDFKNELDLVADHLNIKRAEIVRLALMDFREHGQIAGMRYFQVLQEVHQSHENVEEKLQEIQEARRSSKESPDPEHANQTIEELKKHVAQLEKDLRGWSNGET